MQRGETDAGGRALAGSDDFQEPQGSVRYVQSTTASNTLEGSFHFPLIIHVLVTPLCCVKTSLRKGVFLLSVGGESP